MVCSAAQGYREVHVDPAYSASRPLRDQEHVDWHQLSVLHCPVADSSPLHRKMEHCEGRVLPGMPSVHASWTNERCRPKRAGRQCKCAILPVPDMQMFALAQLLDPEELPEDGESWLSQRSVISTCVRLNSAVCGVFQTYPAIYRRQWEAVRDC